VPRSASSLSLTRRSLLVGLGAGVGLAAVHGLGVGRRLASFGRDGTRASAEILRELGMSLTDRQREQIVFPSDHPTRQIVNTISVIDRPHIGTLLSARQLSLVEELAASMLSPRGQADFAGTFAVEGRFEGCVLAIYGDPVAPAAQAVLQGGHLMLRSGGADPEAAAFGGGVAYGHQIGNGEWRIPGNSFAWHGDAANRLFAALAPEQRRQALLPVPPHELVVQVQGPGVALPGVAFGRLGEAGMIAAGELLEAVFASFPEAERSRARSCIAHNGGLDALRFSIFASKGFYADMRSFGELDEVERTARGDPYWQVWRIEGPGSVIHFQGHPHVHAYVNLVRDPARANLGPSLGETAGVAGDAMLALLESALRRATGEAIAFYGDQAPGRFCPGTVTTGLAYALDPYGNQIVVATLSGRALGSGLRARLERGGVAVVPERDYRVATTDYRATDAEDFGEPAAVDATGVLVRDALVAHLREPGVLARQLAQVANAITRASSAASAAAASVIPAISSSSKPSNSQCAGPTRRRRRARFQPRKIGIASMPAGTLKGKS
jgi:hypothetical protein